MKRNSHLLFVIHEAWRAPELLVQGEGEEHGGGDGPGVPGHREHVELSGEQVAGERRAERVG
eukprot:7995507-Pyramimonas_sp.AAC.1